MPKIDRMFAFVMADNGPDDEGVMGVQLSNGNWMPLVGADMARVCSLRPIADQVAAKVGKPYKILEFALVGELKGEGEDIDDGKA